MIIYKRLFQTLIILVSVLISTACSQRDTTAKETNETAEESYAITPAANRLNLYLDKLKGKSIGLVVNQTSRVGDTHLVDSLLTLGIDIHSVFAPEHGFRGKADAGEHIENGKDAKTDLSLISLYGKNKKPTNEQLEGVDYLVFDIQDVGARFYTYISTLHYVMEACAEQSIPILVLDRPNPNGHYIDGPILEKELKSFVGMHPVPIVYGMTIGEYALMINGESWLSNGIKANLEVIPCLNYDHSMFYDLPIKPSPNLPNARSVVLYPSLCFFEGSVVSIGRGTEKPFQLIGHPDMDIHQYSFTPKTMEGAKYPKLEGKVCYGLELSKLNINQVRQQKQLDLSYLIDAFAILKEKGSDFFLENNFFDKLAGTYSLRTQIEAGLSPEEIRESWQQDISRFKEIRAKYLIY